MAYRSTLLATVLALCWQARADNGHIEYATLVNSSSFDGLHSFGFYSPTTRSSAVQAYGLAELAWYRYDGDPDYHFNFRVGLGLSTEQVLSPFVEIGTNIVDLLILFGDDDDDNDVCDRQQENCDFDIDVKAGLRYQLTETWHASLYYQRIHFGDTHDTLTGNHDITGIGIGYRF